MYVIYPLHLTAESNREHIVGLIKQHNANNNYYPGFTETTLLQLASMHNDSKCIMNLLLD